MAKEPTPGAPDAAAKPKRGKLLLLVALAVPLLLAGGGGAAWFLVPGMQAKVMAMVPGGHAAAPVATAAATVHRPNFVDIPEMAVTLPNGGRARQLRIRMTLELSSPTDTPSEVLSPRLYDALLSYLRTLRDGEVESGLAVDRLRADLYRRADLVLGNGVVKDVLITSLVMG